jgi:hypothetical protein
MKKQAIVTRESLQAMLDQADEVKRQHIVGRALVALFNRQTQAEQSSNHTQVDNGVGFAGCDSKSGSLTAKSYLKNKSLQGWQVEKWLKRGTNGFARLCKYAGQLNEIALIKQQKEKHNGSI